MMFNPNMTYVDNILYEFFQFWDWAKWPFLLAIVLIIADLKFGTDKAKVRKEEIRTSRAVRRTVNKLCDYVLWVTVAYSFGKAFGEPFGIPLLPLIAIVIVYGVEINSCYKNYFEAKGRNIKVNVLDLFKSKTDIFEIKEDDETK